MTNKELIESLQILMANHMDRHQDIWAEHDEYGISAATVADLTEEQVKRLIDLDWFIDDDYCENPQPEIVENHYNRACFKCDTCKEQSFRHYC